jgi:hypothetical protein
VIERGRLLMAALGFSGCAILAAVALGCNRGPNIETRRECDTAKRWLNLDEGGVARCLRDIAFREQLRPQVDERFAAQLTATHNQDRGVLQLRGAQPSSFTRLAKPSALPVQVLGDEKDEKHIGERYIVRARVSWSESDEPNLPPHIFLDPMGGSDKEITMVGTDALDQYQRQFLSTYCWMGGPPPTLCEGDVYLEIRRDARGFNVEAEVIGADFAEGDPKAVLAHFASSRPATRAK